MKFLHTSDWHLGRSLYGRKRYNEFSDFLKWLANTITKEGIDALLVAGDIFDTTTPGNRAQELYYSFLCSVSNTSCKNIIITAGNHDSPSFLNAPKQLLKALNVHVVGSITDDIKDEVIILKNREGIECAIICAVPYLRDRDVRIVEAGESTEDKNLKLAEGIKKHYSDVTFIATEKQKEHGDIPIIAMGHLFATGGKTVDGDGVRDLYVGSLAHIGEDSFPSSIDYLALGHLHVPQKIGKSEHIRYSGSPIPMGYGEAGQNKKVIIITFTGRNPNIQEYPVPCFQELERIVGSGDEIISRLEELKEDNSSAWVEIEFTGTEMASNLRDEIDECLKGSSIEVRRIKNRRLVQRVISNININETLDDLSEEDVFSRCLDTYEVQEEERPLLKQLHREIITSIKEEGN